MKISVTILKLKSGYDFETNNFKGALFCINVAEVTVLILYTFSDAALYCIKFHENFLDGF